MEHRSKSVIQQVDGSGATRQVESQVARGRGEAGEVDPERPSRVDDHIAILQRPRGIAIRFERKEDGFAHLDHGTHRLSRETFPCLKVYEQALGRTALDQFERQPIAEANTLGPRVAAFW